MLAPIVVAFILLIFSETFPKVLATQFPERLSLLIVKPYEWILWILSPHCYIDYVYHLSGL